MKSASENSGTAADDGSGWLRRSFKPFRTATLRGLGFVLPPLLTIVFFIWVWGIINSYIVKPVDSALVSATVWLHHSDIRSNDDIQSEIAASQGKIQIKQVADHQVVQANDGVTLARIGKQWIPYSVVETVERSPGNPVFSTPYEYYERYVRLRYLKPRLVVPATIAVFITVLYLLGKFLTVGIGRLIWHQAEYLITQIPIIRNVYSSVKQITDFAFN